MKKSPVPKPRPRSKLAPKKSPVPMSRDEGMASLALKRYMAGATSREGEDMKTFGKPDKKAKGGKLKMVEKGGKKVPSFAADGVGKMAKGGMCRGMGAASKGGKYKA